MKKPVLIDFKIFNGDHRVQFGKLPAEKKARLEKIAYRAKSLLQENDCRIHDKRYQSLLLSVVDGEVDIQASVCCAEYAKDIRKMNWRGIGDSLTAIAPCIGGALFDK